MGLITTGPGSPLAFSSASGGKIYAFNNINETTNTTVAPANTSRQKITFHNPGANDVFVSTILQQTSGSDAALAPTNAALGGAFRVYGNGGTLSVEGECQGAWQAIGVTGSGVATPLTVMDSNT